MSFVTNWIPSIIRELGKKRNVYTQTTTDNITGKLIDVAIAQYQRGQISTYIKNKDTDIPLIEVTILFTASFSNRATQIRYQAYKDKPENIFNLEVVDPDASILRMFFQN